MARGGGIERFERQIGIREEAPGVDYRVQQIDSETIGASMRGMGQSLLATAEPYLKDRATKRAQEDVGKQMPMVRNANGELERAKPLPGGGTVYREVFAKTANHLYRVQLNVDNSNTFAKIRSQYENEPDKAWSAMTAHTEAVLKAVPPDIRAEVFSDLLQEQSQQFNGLNAEKIKRDRALAVSGLNAEATQIKRTYIANVNSLLNKGDLEGALAEKGKALDRLKTNLERRKEWQSITEIDERAELEELNVIGSSSEQEVAAMQGMWDILQNAGDLANDPDQLELMISWESGPQGGPDAKLGNLSFKEYYEKVPDPKMRRELAGWANRRLSQLREEAREAEEARRQAEQDKKDEDEITAAEAAGAGAGLTTNQIKSLDNQTNKYIVDNFGRIDAMMASESKEGLQYMGQVVGKWGYLPKIFREWMERNSTGRNAVLVAEAAFNLRDMQDQYGNYVGQRLYRDLDPATRAMSDFYGDLKDSGTPTADIRALVLAKVGGQLMSKTQAFQLFKNSEGKPDFKIYRDLRNKYIRKIWNINEAELPVFMRDAIDNSIGTYMTLYGDANPEAGLRRTMEAVAAQWQPSAYGIRGFVPTEFKMLKVSADALDRELGFKDANGRMVAEGAFSTPDKFGRPRARLEFADTSQLASGLGNYVVRLYDQNGEAVPNSSRLVNLDAPVSRILKVKAGLEARIKQERLNLAREQNRRWKEPISDFERNKARRKPIGGY